jgi:hypothetical protein
MLKPNECIRRALRFGRELTLLADEADLCREDDGCGVLAGVLRDCAYEIRAQAERERDAHRRQGVWNAGEPVMPGTAGDGL